MGNGNAGVGLVVDGGSLAGTGSDWCRIEDVYSTLQSSYSLTSEKRSDP